MLDFTLPSREELEGEDRLEVIRKVGPKAAVTDYAILLGCYVRDEHLDNEPNTLENRTATYWTRTGFSFSMGTGAYFMYDGGWTNQIEPEIRFYGGRPMVDYSEIEEYVTKQKINKYGVLEVEYGEYPGMLADSTVSKQLEKLYEDKILTRTKKKYTCDRTKWQDKDKGFSEKKIIEYEYNREKYIRFVATSNSNGLILSNGEEAKEDKAYWIKVEPIVWYVYEETDMAFSKKVLFSGIQYDEYKKYSGSFLSTNMKRFLDKCFSKEIIPTKVYKKSEDGIDSIFEEAIEQVDKINNKVKIKNKSLF